MHCVRRCSEPIEQRVDCTHSHLWAYVVHCGSLGGSLGLGLGRVEVDRTHSHLWQGLCGSLGGSLGLGFGRVEVDRTHRHVGFRVRA